MAKKKLTPEETLLAIGERLKALRIEKGFSSYEKFAWDNEINRVQYYRMEKGANITIIVIWLFYINRLLFCKSKHYAFIRTLMGLILDWRLRFLNTFVISHICLIKTLNKWLIYIVINSKFIPLK